MTSTDPAFHIGHWTDRRGGTGCTVVYCPGGAIGGVHVGGGAPCTRETDIFRLHAGVDPRRVHGVLLVGASVFGLAAADGVVRCLSEKGIGLWTAHACVPIVGVAGIYDLAFGDSAARPDPEAGYHACANARPGRPREGSVGVGTGATVAKAAGMAYCSKAGIGYARERLRDGHFVDALIGVNAFGEVVDPKRGEIVAGIRRPGRRGFRPTADLLRVRAAHTHGFTNTTVGVVMTSIPLTHEEANELALRAHDGLARVLRPSHTRLDGDTIFTLSNGEGARGQEMLDLMWLAEATKDAVSRAVLRAVQTGRHKTPGLVDAP